MVTDSFLTLACAGLIGTLFGLALCFSGYRLFLVLLPIWGFVFGLFLGAQTIQALLGDAFLATVTSWVVGFIVALIFAVLSYLFYMFAVLFLAGSLGYAIAVGLLLWIGLDFGFIVWLIGIVAAVALAIVTIVFNLQKWVIIVATAIMGAGVIFGTMISLFNPVSRLLENPVQVALQESVLLLILFIVLAIAGIAVQFRANREYTLESYDRWAEMSA